MEEKIYNIQGEKLIIKEIKIKQLEIFLGLFGEIDFDSNSLKGIGDIIKVIRQQGIKNFMEIVFSDQDISTINWNEVSYNQFREIVKGFFLLNETLKDDLIFFLNNFLPKLVGILMAFSKSTPTN